MWKLVTTIAILVDRVEMKYNTPWDLIPGASLLLGALRGGVG